MKSLLFRLVHYLISLGELLYYLVVWLPTLTATFKKASSLSIQADGKSLKKIPSHLGLVIAEDGHSLKDLANLIVWSVSLGISYISVYDINGEIKRNSFLLQQNIDASKSELLGTDQQSTCDIQICSPSYTVIPPHLTSSKSSSKGKVYLLCCEDGRRRIVNLAQSFSQMVVSGLLKVEEIQPPYVDKVLQDSLQFPDPELVLKCGPVNSLLGYLPWQIRLTEIISLPSHKGITYKTFLSSLTQFGNTDQRFGK